MNRDTNQPAPNRLWPAILRRSQKALESGALQPIGTREEVIEQAGVHCVARVVMNLALKDLNRRQRDSTGAAPGQTDPFLPPDPDLFVADVSATHFCLLNKFSVIDHHVLIVTRRFEPQEVALNRSDFEALWTCMAEFDALGFYNSGAIAGASETHRHLQLVPLPLSRQGDAIPIAPLLGRPVQDGRLVSLPFAHAMTGLDPLLLRRPAGAAAASHEHYLSMLDRLGIAAARTEGGTQPAPYNLLVSRNWMLMVPRSRERFTTISVNALGFAGSFFLRSERELATLRRVGPMNVLRAVAISGFPSR